MEIPVMFCLRCGYRQEAHGGANYTKNDKAHHKRCDYTMTIRHMNSKTGRITDGERRYT